MTVAPHYVLVLNCGSSSLKFAVIDPETGTTPVKGTVECLDQACARMTVTNGTDSYRREIRPANHAQALARMVAVLDGEGVMNAIRAIGHRVVHGGEYFSESVRIDEKVRARIAECARLAPLHNPAHVTGIEAAQKAFPDLPQVAVFDTAFHHKLPEKAYLYPLPLRFYRDYHIRKYGFHGTSYRYIATRIQALTGQETLRSVVCHLGNGGSVAAIAGDNSRDTTMGLTPLEGIVHGTRCGDIDPAIPRILTEQFGIAAEEVEAILWRQSGLLGLSRISNDCRTLEARRGQGDQAAERALEVYCYRLAKHIAGQMVALNGCDLLVFTGGIGENSSYIRARTVEQLAFLGCRLDETRNAETLGGRTALISAPDSMPIWVIPTDEELLIARDTARLAAAGKNEEEAKA